MHPLRPIAAVALTTFLAASTPLAAQDAQRGRDSLLVTFLANEGVMLTAGGTSVLIDALFGDGLRGYGVVTPDTRALLERAAPPFDRVAAVLATHVHRDHFDAAPAWRHLQDNPRARFISTPEAVDSVRAIAGPAAATVGGRLIAALPAKGERRLVGDVLGVRIHALGLPHGSGTRRAPPQNVGFVVEIGGFRVLHIGDTGEPSGSFSSLRLDELGIDLALLPSWYLTGESLQDVVRRTIRPRTIAALHVTPFPGPNESSLGGGAAERERVRIRAAFPRAHVFDREMETFVVR
jgi:L-ascorbate metabolism protein UlaG (beta-lactamase superfamily)